MTDADEAVSAVPAAAATVNGPEGEDLDWASPHRAQDRASQRHPGPGAELLQAVDLPVEYMTRRHQPSCRVVNGSG